MVVRVLIEDVETGTVGETTVAEGDYFIVVVDPCHVAKTEESDDGQTHVVTIRGRVE